MLEFLGVARSHHVKKLNKLLEQATEAVGGTLVQSPFYELLGQGITVHPIGYVSSVRRCRPSAANLECRNLAERAWPETTRAGRV